MPGEVGPSLPDTHEEHVQVAPHNEQRGSGPPLAIIQIEGCPQKQSAMLSISHDGDYASAVCIYMPGGPQDS